MGEPHAWMISIMPRRATPVGLESSPKPPLVGWTWLRLGLGQSTAPLMTDEELPAILESLPK